ncbi:non-ribosomal peptide synthetase [Bacillus wiedmannii]|uniref:non-ribosomal peptide synthetase n=2 Tax=Bacillus cereus group TaxID=86661 RepID=UPI0025A28D5D|nr:non-ribosomal peptide synthetase [Bacillus wiedmannii]MDM5265145.1 amino acid adenylation domain-containing protein [Bacillus wiedmannii]
MNISSGGLICVDETDKLVDAENSKILFDFNKTEKLYRKQLTLHRLFEEQVEKTPNSIALDFGDEVLTYHELNSKANRLARILIEKKVQPDYIVGIMINRSTEMFIAMLAVLKAGAAFLAIDPEYPLERIQYMIKNSGINHILTEGAFVSLVPSECESIICIDHSAVWRQVEEESNLPDTANSENLAYVFYTSGSTGKPKGVKIKHKNVHNQIVGMTSKIPFESCQRILAVTTVSFDPFIIESLLALSKGLYIVIASEEEQTNPGKLARLIVDKKIDLIQSTPSRLQMLLRDVRYANCFERLQYLLVGGEPLTRGLVQKLKKVTKAKVYNLYGPTETTVWSTVQEIHSSNQMITVGKPISNVKIYIVDKYLNLQPIGAPGEICISGDGVGEGYINLDELTHEKFIPNPFSSRGKMYRTGDLGCWHEDGTIEHLGRIDDQVKIRGYRIELGEVTETIQAHTAIEQAVVIANKDSMGDFYLCAYYISKSDCTVGELRKHLALSLPEYMIPSFFVKVKEFQLSPNGKIDKKSLPVPQMVGQSNVNYVAPRNKEEEVMVDIWKEVLELEEVGIRDNFFELGGHSLKAASLLSKIEEYFGIVLSLRKLFLYSTIEEIMSYIQGIEKKSNDSIKKAKDKQFYPATSSQRRMYVLQQMEGSEIGTSYNIPLSFHIKGQIDIGRFKKAIELLIKRHESLRTTFQFIDDVLVQKINHQCDWKLIKKKILFSEAQAEIEKFVQPFDLGKTPLFRIGLFEIKEEEHIFIMDIHHIISDGVSNHILLDELARLYQGGNLQNQYIQYKDYSEWKRSSKQMKTQKKQGEYWIEQFSGDIPVLELPIDFPRSSVQNFIGRTYKTKLASDMINELKRKSTEQNVTPYMMLLAAYVVLMSKYSNQEEIIVGTPVVGRSKSQLENVIGVFINTLAISSRPKSEQRFSEFLSQIKEQVLDAFENSDYPFEELIENLSLSRDASRNPLFDTLFSLQNMEENEFSIPGLEIEPYEWDKKTTQFDLGWDIIEWRGEMYLSIEYSSTLFKPETIEKLTYHYKQILNAILENPDSYLGEIELVNETEKQQILVDFNCTELEYDKTKTIQDLFEEQVEKTPDEVAVVYEKQQLTYCELNERANQLAHVLRQHEVGKEQVVGILLDRSIDMVVAALGVLKAGGAYLPIDSENPMERIVYMLEDSQASVLLMHKHNQVPVGYKGQFVFVDDEDLYVGQDATPVENINTPQDLAYIIYTSGSTGNPKGVMIEHQSVNNLRLSAETFGIGPGSRVLQCASFSFDQSVGDMYYTILNGGTLYISSKELLLSGERFINWLHENQISSIPGISPSILKMLPYMELPHLKTISTGGEALSADLVRTWGVNRTFLNAYGPTEATVDSTIGVCRPDMDIAPIGKPIFNKKVYILNSQYQVQPVGVAGEMYIGGDGLARGYLNRPDLTSEQFVPNPFVPGEQMYKTGDLVRWLPDGNIEYLGRVDNQVKIRGHRIEIGEIETCLRKHPSIKEAVVIARKDKNEQDYLCVYVVAQGEWTIQILRQFLGQTLPHYMIPSYFMELSEIPLTTNGKVDKKAMPEPDGKVKVTEEYVPPTNRTEEILTQIWEEVLGIEQIGIHDNFFVLGGDSIKSLQIAARLNRLELKLEIKDLFKHPTVFELAPHIQTKRTIAQQGTVEGEVIMTPIQRWFFAQQYENSHHWNQSMMLYNEKGWNSSAVECAFNKLIEHHDALRMSYKKEHGQIIQLNRGLVENLFNLKTFDLTQEVNIEVVTRQKANEIQQSFDLEKGPLVGAAIFKTQQGDHLLIVVHHLVIDGVSWRILLEDYETLYHNPNQSLPLKTTSFQEWSNKLLEYANSETLLKEVDYWNVINSKEITALPKDKLFNDLLYLHNSDSVSIYLGEEETTALLTQTHRAYNTEINDLLLTALVLTVKEWAKTDCVAIDLEGHGRETIDNRVDLSRTIGWFTSEFPVIFEINNNELPHAIKMVKETLRKIPNKGIGHGIIKYLTDRKKHNIDFKLRPEIIFNYLGQFEQVESPSDLPLGDEYSLDSYNPHLLEINCMVVHGKLRLEFIYNTCVYHRQTIKQLGESYTSHLLTIIEHCRGKEGTEQTPSDFNMKKMTIEDLEDVFSFFE